MTTVLQPDDLTGNTNLLLNSLSAGEQQLFFADCELVQLEFGNQLCHPNENYRFLYFPLTGFISLIAKLKGHPPLEMGLIGFEGMLGATLVLQNRQVPLEAIVQGEGQAWRIPVVLFELFLTTHPHLRTVLHCYLFQLMTQLSANAVCAHFHQIEERLARWLLMSQDRSQQHELYLTHQFLAEMLGVRRSGITVAAGDLQLKGLIHYQRGHVKILDRPGLLQQSCACYQGISPP
ncbi:Crp/Fnr family transcriptional regulator [Rheinheimera sp.]|uniref:Crp/Fnr family transcriptional regulator n=1 Tax=Rheinheimera sp. TaxID=1869214 RepID=UPI0027BAC7FA|nr:Crp/Fnr family transcriptional regulator [Rheinheimera sp.]